MDFGLTAEQSDLVGAVETLLARHAGPDRAREVAANGGFDAVLMEALRDGGYLDLDAEGAGPLEAVLVTELVARAAGCVPIGVRTLVAPAVLDGDRPMTVAVVGAGDGALARYAQFADVLLVDGAAVMATEAKITPAPSMFGYPLAAVTANGAAGSVVDAEAVWRWSQVAVAAELVGTMEAALDLTADHLRERHQFGRPLGAFQALQHRLAELHIGIEGARWLTRFAAAHGAQPQDAAVAAAYASMVAEAITREAHQMSGAMGLTMEYDLYLWTMRLPTLRMELGDAHAHHVALARARWLA